MSLGSMKIARLRVLERLGIDRIVSADYLDIDAGHRAHAEFQRHAATFTIDGLTIEAPAGVYHPDPESSSMLFIRNIWALDAKPARTLEIGTGCGAIALFVLNRWRGYVLATDISATTLESAHENARRNGLDLKLAQSDLYANVDEGNFNLIVFNTPLIDKAPEDDLERQALCDPGGRILRGYLDGLPDKLTADGFALFGICCNTAYQQLDGLPLDFRVVGFELIGGGFWRAIVAARIA